MMNIFRHYFVAAKLRAQMDNDIIMICMDPEATRWYFQTREQLIAESNDQTAKDWALLVFPDDESVPMSEVGELALLSLHSRAAA